MVQIPSFFKRHRSSAPYLIYLFSVCYLIFLVSSSQPGIFFSGDGGMKFIVVKQLLAGHGFKVLYLPQPAWVQAIWKSGFFPFRTPFVYPSPKGDLFSFPPYFQLISAIFYGWFGYAGLYILPVLSAVLLWWVMIRLLRLVGVPEMAIAGLLFILVFCSPLTLYGAAYWEHMPAVLLLCGGFAFILGPAVGRLEAAALGLCAGLAVWFRPEAIAMDLLLGLAAVILYTRDKNPRGLYFVSCMAIVVAAFLAVNRYEYGSFLGVHSYQVLQEHSLFYKIGKGCKNLLVINWTSVRYFPFLLVLLPVLYAIWKGGARYHLRTTLLLSVLILFCVLSPFMLPNDGGMQWGARYFLPVIPLFILVIASIGVQAGSFEKKPTGWPALVLLAAVGYSLVLNSFFGGEVKLREANYSRVKPALDYTQQQAGEVVVVGSGYVPMEMGSIFDRKYFFLAEDDTALTRLHQLLKQQNVHEYLYITQQDSAPRLPNLLLPDKGNGLVQKGNYFFARYVVPD